MLEGSGAKWIDPQVVHSVTMESKSRSIMESIGIA